MDLQRDDRREVVRPRELHWLSSHAAAWLREGLIDATQHDRIVGRYRVDTLAGQRRVLATLTALAVVAAFVAVILVVGYNWNAIPRAAKVTLIFAAVMTAFGASALAYARGRNTAGELIAFAGTLLFGNGIWLLAQVFQIRSHYPNGALWWMAGALLTAHLLRSPLIAIEAAVLLGVWVLMELGAAPMANYVFLPFGALVVWLAYRVRSSWTLGLSAIVIAGWVATTAAVIWMDGAFRREADGFRLAVGFGALCGCTLWTAAFHRVGDEGLRRVWRGAGVFVLGACLVPLMSRWFQVGRFGQVAIDPPSLTSLLPLLVLASALAAFALVSAAREQAEARGNWPVLLTLGLLIIWIGAFLLAPRLRVDASFQWTMTIGFSAATVAVGAGLLHAAIREQRGWFFLSGIGYVLLFLIVRWIDLMGNMLWSALFLLLTAAALVMLARLWRTRRSVGPEGGL
jgi:uncharacterized membrane protein